MQDVLVIHMTQNTLGYTYTKVNLHLVGVGANLHSDVYKFTFAYIMWSSVQAENQQNDKFWLIQLQ